MLKLYVKVGYYDRNVMRNAFSLAVKGEKRCATSPLGAAPPRSWCLVTSLTHFSIAFSLSVFIPLIP
jgi:hypothetical protein